MASSTASTSSVAGERLSLELPMPLGRSSGFDLLSVLHGLVFFACGAALALLRPRDWMVRLVAVCMMLCGFTFLPLYSGRGFFLGREAAVYFASVSTSAWVYSLC